eukprot:CAMPEP_0185036284 /NCGR_PEP_ID=MMETSP1103-20130426/29047_1 /TAXON_ID=36769 /ORGANISM="Paraphysomonas bandaiensis, Strain Caron Lab Isolate" /LENGTH=531 /DNA_ID=CAMNT_0027573779 /DNA_START=243 /DNA_END=1838 /DNA_ORIENTATION=+
MEYHQKILLDDARSSSTVSTLSPEKKEEMDRLFGFPEPPNLVYALGRHESAAVWWHYDDDSDIIEWEVHRYRKDLTGDTWKHKGSMPVKFLKKIKQIIFEGLTNGREYRFSVKARNKQGYSRESPCSNSVLIEADLPFGWKRVLQESTKEFVYTNSHLNQTLTTRPDADPYFLEEFIAELFHAREIHHLRELYDEEILHFESVGIVRYKEILFEIGERFERRDIQFLFRYYLNDELEIKSYQKFMDITAHIKREKMNEKLFNVDIDFSDKTKEKQLPKKLTKKKDFMVGDWIVRWHPLAERWQYVHTLDESEVLWCMPNQVKFHLSDAEWDKLHNTFDFGMVERIKLQFEEINRSRTGNIDESEFYTFLDAVDAGGDKLSRQLFFRSIDTNNNGTIEFSEFAMLMCKLAKRKPKTGLLGKLEAFALLQEIAENGPVRMQVTRKGPLNRGTSGYYQVNEVEASAQPDDIQEHPPALETLVKSKKFCCCFGPSKGKIAAMSSRLLEFTSLQKRVGPHGRYCMCGCRNLHLIDD